MESHRTARTWTDLQERKEKWRENGFVHENTIKGLTNQHGPKHNKVHAAGSYLLGNREFAWDFVDIFISEVLLDEFVPDVLIETLTHSFAKNQKSYPLKFHHKRQMKSLLELQAPMASLSVQHFSRSLMDDLLLEVLKEFSVSVLRNTMKELVDGHLARSAMFDIADEIVTEAVQSLLPVAIQETQWELEWEETLDAVICDVIEEEVRAIVVSVLSELNAELLKLQHKQVTASAEKYLIDLFLLEHLTGMYGPALPWKDEARRCLDSWMLNILLRQNFHIHEQQRATVENLLLEDFHQKAFQEVALDVILTELSKSLEEDMEDLLENEIQTELGDILAD